MLKLEEVCQCGLLETGGNGFWFMCLAALISGLSMAVAANRMNKRMRSEEKHNG